MLYGLGGFLKNAVFTVISPCGDHHATVGEPPKKI
jgi:hypothetical protein